MGSKLGVHIENVVDHAGMVEWFKEAQPAIAKLIDDDPGFVRECKAVSPQTFWVGRAFTQDQDVDKPQAHFERIMRKAMVRDVHAWEGYNEVTGGHGWDDKTRRYLEFELQLCNLLHSEGVKYVAGSWSVGCPSDLNVWRWSYMLDLLKIADYLGLHEYCAPTMWEPRAFDPRYGDKESYLVSGWFTLRYRKAYATLFQGRSWSYDFMPPPIIISECGIDSGAAHWDTGAQGGWKSFTDVDGYMEQLAWYDRQLRMDDYVVGATIFTFGTRSQHLWESYDCWEPKEMRDALAAYIREEPEPPPPPPSDLDKRVAALEKQQTLLGEELKGVIEDLAGLSVDFEGLTGSLARNWLALEKLQTAMREAGRILSGE